MAIRRGKTDLPARKGRGTSCWAFVNLLERGDIGQAVLLTLQMVPKAPAVSNAAGSPLSGGLVSENDALHCPGETELSDIQGDIPAKPAGALSAHGSIAFSPGPRAQAPHAGTAYRSPDRLVTSATLSNAKDGRNEHMTKYDVAVIGAGHNALTSACYLAKAGKKVVVLERRPVIGGAACTEEMFGGYKVDIGSSIHVLFPTTGIAKDLELEKHGLEYIELDPWGFYPIKGTDKAITFYRSLDKTCESIAAISPRDAETYRDF
ncbi:MAG: NAD(P)-binding protein, partial [Pseudomonadota bacterium]|nr:NAD(P)-binding protein [Pseudomonadota bacterium]